MEGGSCGGACVAWGGWLVAEVKALASIASVISGSEAGIVGGDLGGPGG